ncbi:iron dependent repressor, metal binding and dimerization domain protein [Clostridium sp. CCUG 7971]|uniref:metal-dependent transcriptional regulator n=1 Tax=Clostridium sp. CCUG 7971 TaxID=2811414 RepID=UPI001ABAD4D4|nr:iron dependent repressor, metal binding and dimerization domain protein [Clostridium sp. CCUG 7971]MBO3445332.1 MarR family transcriptional regulator [Clostridium sp. CCUG 7971]
MENKKEYYTFNEYIKRSKLTPSEEDYIEMIYRLFLQEDHVKVSDISKHLNITPPSVTKMVKKLSEKELILYKKYDYVVLSDMGKIIGQQLLNRHYIVNKFLNLLGVKDKIHEETEKIEHTISIETLIKIEEHIEFFNSNKDILEKLKEYQKKG